MADQPARPAADDWTTQVADRIESIVETVRTKTTLPVTKVARIVVFGLILLPVLLAAGVLSVIAVVRLVDVYLPLHPVGRRVWVVDVGLGAIFLLAGAFSMRRRTARSR